MLLGGDEIGRTQGGNNNAYCQDNEISYYDWSLRDENIELLGFTRKLMEFRREHPNFRRRKWFEGRDLWGTGLSDIGWFNPDGTEMTQEQWDDDFAKTIGVFLNGEEIPSPGPRGERITDDSFLLLFNAHSEAMDFTIPTGDWGEAWEVVIDTRDHAFETAPHTHKAGEKPRGDRALGRRAPPCRLNVRSGRPTGYSYRRASPSMMPPPWSRISPV